MSDVNVFLVFCSVIMAIVVHVSGKRVVLAEKDVKRWALRCKHATARANRRGRELRARDVAARRKKKTPLTFAQVEALLRGSLVASGEIVPSER